MEAGANHKSLDEFPASWLRPDLWLEEKARSRPEKLAILFRERAITYRDLWERVARLAAGLTQRGLRFGDRIAFGPDYFHRFRACGCTIPYTGCHQHKEKESQGTGRRRRQTEHR